LEALERLVDLLPRVLGLIKSEAGEYGVCFEVQVARRVDLRKNEVSNVKKSRERAERRTGILSGIAEAILTSSTRKGGEEGERVDSS
jgi:hypothetical protein